MCASRMQSHTNTDMHVHKYERDDERSGHSMASHGEIGQGGMAWHGMAGMGCDGMTHHHVLLVCVGCVGWCADVLLYEIVMCVCMCGKQQDRHTHGTPTHTKSRHALLFSKHTIICMLFACVMMMTVHTNRPRQYPTQKNACKHTHA